MSAEARDGQRRFVDSNLFVYAYDSSAGGKREASRELIARLWRTGQGCLSVQVLQELFVNLTRKIPKPLVPREAATLLEDLTA